jgi:hypothetical protein
MRNRIRQLAAAAAVCALLFAHAAPASAQSSSLTNADREATVPVMVDALFLRPVGLVVTVIGAGIFAVPVAPLMLITRPTDIGKPFNHLIVAPARYTFVDPLGLHPPRQ